MYEWKLRHEYELIPDSSPYSESLRPKRSFCPICPAVVPRGHSGILWSSSLKRPCVNCGSSSTRVIIIKGHLSTRERLYVRDFMLSLMLLPGSPKWTLSGPKVGFHFRNPLFVCIGYAFTTNPYGVHFLHVSESLSHFTITLTSLSTSTSLA